MKVVAARDATELAEMAASIFRDRVRAMPDLAMAVPAGRTPRRMYATMERLQATDPVDFSAMRVFSVDELCPPAPPDGYFWRQLRREFFGWANVSPDRCRPFRVDAPDLVAMCEDYEGAILACGGLDLVMLGLGPNAHIASNEPGTAFDARTRPVRLLDTTVAYILTDDVIQGEVCERAVTLGMTTILAAHEVVLLVSGVSKRDALRRVLDGPITPDVPASILRLHASATVLADGEAIS